MLLQVIGLEMWNFVAHGSLGLYLYLDLWLFWGSVELLLQVHQFCNRFLVAGSGVGKLVWFQFVVMPLICNVAIVFVLCVCDGY